MKTQVMLFIWALGIALTATFTWAAPTGLDVSVGSNSLVWIQYAQIPDTGRQDINVHRSVNNAEWETVAVLKDMTPPGRIEGFRALGVEDGIRLSWQASSKDKVKHYRIYRSLVRNTEETPEPVLYRKLGVEQTGFVDKQVDPNQMYTYSVSAISHNDVEGPRSFPIPSRVKDSKPPGPPANLSGKAGEKGVVTLTWRAPGDPDLATFRVYRGLKGVSEKAALPYIKATGKKMTFKNTVDALSPFPYVYWVSSVDTAGNESRLAGPLEIAVPDKRPPQAPILSGLSLKKEGIEITWVPPADMDLRGFWIYRREKGADSGHSLLIKNFLPKNQTRYLDRSIKPGDEYAYTLVALDMAGNQSRMSGERSRKVPAKIDRQTPAGLKVRHLKDGSNQLSWKPVKSNGLLGYLVYRSTDGSADYLQVSSIVDHQKFKDKDVQDLDELWYRVKAVYKNGRMSEASKPAVWKRPKPTYQKKK